MNWTVSMAGHFLLLEVTYILTLVLAVQRWNVNEYGSPANAHPAPFFKIDTSITLEAM